MSGSQTPPSQTTTLLQSPEQKELLQMAMPGLRSYANTTPQYYPGSTVAPMNETQNAAVGGLTQSAYNLGNNASMYTGEALRQANAIPSTLQWTPANLVEANANINYNVPGRIDNPFQYNFWNRDFNPALNDAIKAIQRPLAEQYAESVLPNIRGGARLTGGIGGSRQGVAEGLASGRFAQAAEDAASKAALSTYGQNLQAALDRYNQNLAAQEARYRTNIASEDQRYATNRQLEAQRYAQNYDTWLKSLGMTPELGNAMIQQGMVGPATQFGMGNYLYGMDQARLSDEVARYNYNQMAPFLAAKDIAGIAQGIGPIGTQSIGSIAPKNQLTSGLGGAMAGGQLGMMIGGPWGAGLGALGGGLFGAFA